MQIKSAVPSAALPEGIVRLEVQGIEDPSAVRVEVGGVRAEIVGASNRALTIRIPNGAGDGIVARNAQQCRLDFRVGQVLATELHPVASPVVDTNGNIYVTYSGRRGEKVPFSIFLISAEGEKQPFLADITNATGMAIGPDNRLYITSRHSGTIYRSSFDKRVEKFVEGLGLATGIAFNSRGQLLVGDRGGNIYRINPEGETALLCQLEPSISAYHLAVDRDDVLYVTGPTLATQDCIYRISPDGDVETYFKGLGRPQGIGFDAEGRLQVAASYLGKKGLYTFSSKNPELTVAGPMLVGFAYDFSRKRLYMVDNEKLYMLSTVSSASGCQ
ncbi:MAG: gluconolaconase [Acidobacteria bacterium]|nr:gluconolaconase [Acidobacteriota bacterium]